MTVYVPPGSTTTHSGEHTFANLMDLVNAKLENYTSPGTDTDTGDGATTVFRLSHQNIVSGSVTITNDGTATTAFTTDLDYGYVTFTSAPDDTHELIFRYQYKHWSDDDVKQALQDGVHELFPYFYVIDLDETVTAVHDTYEYTLPDLVEVLMGVEYRPDSNHKWERLDLRAWEVITHGATQYLQIHANPPNGYFRLRIVRRAQPFVLTTETLSNIGLPGTATKPLVLYACWDLINQKLVKRVRTDSAITTQREGAVPSYEVARAASAFRMAYEASLAQTRMAPWSVR